MSKDLYSILGVNKNASYDEIKKSYKELARKYHPDKWTDKSEKERKEAEEKFKEVGEAYSVLSDKDKRQNYDMFGNTDGASFSGGWSASSADDFFRNFMHNNGFGFGATQRANVRGKDKKIRISVTLEDIFFERFKNVTYEVERSCDECGGSGSSSGLNTKCPHCGGSGFITKTQRWAGGYSQQTSPCPHCNGTGYVVQDPCHHCNGTGVTLEKVTQNLQVPTIDKINLTYKMGLEGNACHNNMGTNGDLYFVFSLKEDANSKFHIDSNNYANICTNLDVSFIDCLTGCEKTIETVSGEKLTVKIPQGTKDGYTVAFSGYGFRLSNRTVGDLLVTVKMVMPKLSNEQISKIKEIVENK